MKKGVRIIPPPLGGGNQRKIREPSQEMPGTAREGPISRRKFFLAPGFGGWAFTRCADDSQRRTLSERCDEEHEVQRLVSVLGGLAAEFGNRVLLKEVVDVAAK